MYLPRQQSYLQWRDHLLSLLLQSCLLESSSLNPFAIVIITAFEQFILRLDPMVSIIDAPAQGFFLVFTAIVVASFIITIACSIQKLIYVSKNSIVIFIVIILS